MTTYAFSAFVGGVAAPKKQIFDILVQSRFRTHHCFLEMSADGLPGAPGVSRRD